MSWQLRQLRKAQHQILGRLRRPFVEYSMDNIHNVAHLNVVKRWIASTTIVIPASRTSPGELLHEGRLREDELRGLRENKLKPIRLSPTS
jgi:hypothetical protein